MKMGEVLSMTEKNVTISIPEGLTAKNVTSMIEKANEYPCSIVVSCNERRVNCKSLLGVLSLGLKYGDEIILSASGEQESDAVTTLSSML